MITIDQVKALLTVAMGYDNRRPGELNVAAWHDAAHLQRWEFAAAVDAIKAHYSESRDFIMPADVTARIRAERVMPLPVAQLPRSGADSPATPDHIRTVVTELREAMGWQGRPSHRDPEMRVRCPWEPCHAAPDTPCTLKTGYHPARTKAAETEDQ